MAVNPIPEGRPRVSAYLIVESVPKLIDFLTTVFGGEVLDRHDDGKGGVMHAEVRIVDSVVMMGEASSKWPASTATLNVYVEDTDETYRRALAAGATSVMEPAMQFYGHRSAGVKDPVGNTWFFATQVEQLSAEEMADRAKGYQEKSAQAATAKK